MMIEETEDMDMEEGEYEQSHMSDGELVALIDSEIETSINGTADNTTEIRRELDLYLGRVPGLNRVDSMSTRSSRIVSMDLMDAIEATTAEVMQMYSGDEIAYFQAEGPDDEAAARQESETINYLFLEQYNGHTLLQSAIKSALLHRNGYVKVYWDERNKVRYESYKNVPSPYVSEIVRPQSDNETVEIVEQEVDGTTEDSNPVEIPETGEIVGQLDVQSTTHSFTIKRVSISSQPCIESLANEHVMVCADHDRPDLRDVRFVCHPKIETESSLIEQGFDEDIVKSLPSYTFLGQEGEAARRRYPSEFLTDTGRHKATRPIEVQECYMLVDYDMDGIAERRKIVRSGSYILSNDPFESVSIISGVSAIMPNRHQGISLKDRLEDIQEGKTYLLRSIINGAQLAANPRIGALNGEINIEDLLMSRNGGVVRMNRPDAAIPFPNPEVPPSVFNTMTFLDQQRRERGGSAIDIANQVNAVAGDTAHGIERTMSALEMYNGLVARNIGETLVRGIFLELHNLLRNNHEGSIRAQVGGRWIESEPGQWRERNNVAVQVGSSMSERTRQAATMERVLNLHEKLYAANIPLVDIKRSYRAITDAIRLSGVKWPERYFIDPESQEGQQKGMEHDQKAQQREMERIQMEQEMAQAQRIIAQAEQMKAQVMARNGELKAQVDQLKAQLMMIKDQADTSLQGQKQAQDFALEATKLELDARRELNQKIAGNYPR